MGCGASRVARQARLKVAEMEDALLDARDQLTRLQHRPVRIFLLRHGQSVAAVDESLQEDVPDMELPLSPEGVEQAEEAGIRLRYALGSEGFTVWSSPFKRAMETASHMLKATRIPEETWPSVRADVRLREQDCGVFEEKKRALSISEQKKRRWEFGAWYYRFESGENGAEVYSRVESFIGSLHRHYQRRVEGPLAEEEGAPRNVVIIAHGVVLRMFLMRWFKLSIDWLHATRNLDHGEYIIVQRGQLKASGGRDGWTMDRELCDHENNPGKIRTPKFALAATVFSSGGPGAGDSSPRKSGKPQGWLSSKLRTAPSGPGPKGRQMTVEKRVAAKKPDIYEIVDRELEKDKARDAELLAVWKGQKVEALRPAQMWSTVTCGVDDETVYGGKGRRLANCKVGKEYVVVQAAYYGNSLKLQLEGMEGWTSLNNKKGTAPLFEQLEPLPGSVDQDSDSECNSDSGKAPDVRAADGRLIGGAASANVDPFEGDDDEAIYDAMSSAQKAALAFDLENERMINELAARD